MGFLDKVKSAAGIDTATLEVDMRQRPSKRGDTLLATARVVPGKKPQKMRYLRVCFEWEGNWKAPRTGGTLEIEGKAWIVKTDWPGGSDITLQPGQTLELPIELQVPPDAPLSSENKIKYKLFVRADIDDAKDPEFATYFDIVG
jgi:sporulation-control protein spo0M